MKFAIFVDGPNLIGALDKLQLKVDDYQSFYLHVVEKAYEVWKECFVGGGTFSVQLWRVFWYQVGHIDELNFSNPALETNLKGIFEKNKSLNQPYMAIAGKENPGKTPEELKEIAWASCFEEGKSWYQTKKSALDGMKRFNFAVRANTNFVEIVESGHWKVDLIRKQITEKGVDTSLAVDLVTLINSYDVAVVISGDADMIPSLSYAKQRKRQLNPTFTG